MACLLGFTGFDTKLVFCCLSVYSIYIIFQALHLVPFDRSKKSIFSMLTLEE